jgi:hypothetical protein
LPENFDVLFGANDEPNAQFVETLHQAYVGKTAIRRENDFGARYVTQDHGKQTLDEGLLQLAAMRFERPLRISTPINRYGAASDDGRSDQQVLTVFDRPIQRNAYPVIPA